MTHSPGLKTSVSVIIPAHNSAGTLGACLKSVFRSTHEAFDVIVVDDHSDDRTAEIARSFPARAVTLHRNAGAAAARNIGAKEARGDILFFLDSDIAVRENTLSDIVRSFEERPGISSLFCSYGKDTVPSNFTSVYKNLVHHFTHQVSREDAATFCSGFGAIRRSCFEASGGFDERYRSLEDIELGYRLFRNGYRIFLNKDIQVTHLKTYTLWSLIQSDVLLRAVPWTRIMLEKRLFRRDLNLRLNNILSVPLSYLLLLNLLFAARQPFSVTSALVLTAGFIALNGPFFWFVFREKGAFFTLRTVFMHWFHYLYSGLGLGLGLIVYLKEFLSRRVKAR